MTPRTDTLADVVTQYHAKYLKTPKFTDDDLRAEPELMDMALEYLAAYEGDFQFLTDLRAKSRGNLSNPQARGVLNTMLADKRRRDNPLEDLPTTGIVLNGYYLPPGHPELQVLPWRTGGERMLRIYNSEAGEWEGFATISTTNTYKLWGKMNSPYLRDLAQVFFTIDDTTRQLWGKAWSDLHNSCQLCARQPPTDPLGLCDSCGTGKWATDIIRDVPSDIVRETTL